jgi:hypothetical protein
MADAFDVDLEDPELLAEILLLADLIVAASESAEPLGQAVIDAILWQPTTAAPDQKASA